MEIVKIMYHDFISERKKPHFQASQEGGGRSAEKEAVSEWSVRMLFGTGIKPVPGELTHNIKLGLPGTGRSAVTRFVFPAPSGIRSACHCRLQAFGQKPCPLYCHFFLPKA